MHARTVGEKEKSEGDRILREDGGARFTYTLSVRELLRNVHRGK